MDWPPKKVFTSYEPYTTRMRATQDGSSRHANFISSLVRQTDTARVESEDAILNEELDLNQVRALNAPNVNDDTEDATAASEVEDTAGTGHDNVTASQVQDEGESDSENELSVASISVIQPVCLLTLPSHFNNTDASHLQSRFADDRSTVFPPPEAPRAPREMLQDAPTHSSPPTAPALGKTRKAKRTKAGNEEEKRKAKETAKQLKLNEAVAYLHKRWGPDVTKYLPAQDQYPPERQRDLQKWPSGVVENLAELAKLTSDSDKRQQALGFLHERVEKRLRKVCVSDVTFAIQDFKEVNGEESADDASLDKYVPLVEQQQTPVGADIWEMDIDTLRVELAKARLLLSCRLTASLAVSSM